MKRNDTVKVKEGEKRAGDIGTIIEISSGYANIYWKDGKLFWIETDKLEVISESG